MLEGRFFPAGSARVIPARAVVAAARLLRIEALDGVLLVEAPGGSVRVSARLGTIARRFEFSDGGRFETDDNDGADILLRQLHGLLHLGLIDRIERSWRWVALSVAVAAVCAYGFVVYGIPAGALKLAQATPREVAVAVSDQTLRTLDDYALAGSQLSAKDKAHAGFLFARVAAKEPRGVRGYRLLFRGGRAIGPNAFALPDGRVVMTDELWRLVKNDEEIEGVFAHEMAHVNHAHGLQRVYQASLIPAALALITGDLSQVSQISVILPGVLVESAYSREFEQQADDDAAATLKRMGGSPARMADLLERLENAHCSKGGCGPSWLGSHPDANSRAAKLRQEAK